MKQLKMFDFGFRKKDFKFKLGMNRKKKSRRNQTELNDYPLKKFKCPVSMMAFHNVLEHNKKCIYKYCKDDWKWSNRF